MAMPIMKHAFWLASLVVAFYLSGMIGLFCEWLHANMLMSSGLFSLSFAGIMAFFFKIYTLFLADLFG
jgi:hypothetical protein